MDDEVLYDEKGRELRPDENPEYWDHANGAHEYYGGHKEESNKTKATTERHDPDHSRSTAHQDPNERSSVWAGGGVVVFTILLLIGMGLFWLISKILSWIF